MIEITEEDFEAYEEVRASGSTNMWNVKLVESFSGLEKAKILEIIKTYDKLNKKYPNVRRND